MKNRVKKFMIMALVVSMCISTGVYAADLSSENKDVANRATAFYEGAGSQFVKISHPEKPTSTSTVNRSDGLLDYLGNGRVGVPGVDEGADGQGDRGQSYCWSAQSYGDWMYLVTQFNPLMSTIDLMDSGLGYENDAEFTKALLNTMYRGEMFLSEEDGGNPGSVFSKINVKTGEVKILMSKEKTGTNVQFRNALQLGNKLYFCGSVNGIPSVYQVDPENNDKIECVFKDESMNRPDAWQQALKKKLSPTIRGMAVYDDYLVVNCVGLDENPYIAISKDPSKGFHKIAFTWENVENKIPGELLGYPACHFNDSIYGGSIWDITEFNGDLYVAMCTGTPDKMSEDGKAMQPFAIIRGRCNGNPEEKGSWTWTPVIGDKKDGAKYTFGIDPERTRSGACSMVVFDDHLYIGEYNDTEIAVADILFDMDATFMADNLKQSVNLYRMDKNENIEMVMGDPTELFPNGGISEMGSGFGKCENQYIWRMDTFQDKLYVGTFDESSILYPVGQISNGDIMNLTAEQWKRQMEYLKELIKEAIRKITEESQQAVTMSLNDNGELEVLQELDEASEDVETEVSILDLPQTMSGEEGYHIESLGELQQAMIMMSGMMDQDENWSEEEKLEAKVRFSQFYEGIYKYYNEPETNEKLPDFVKEVYGQILNSNILNKVSGMARCVIYLRNNVRGFDMMVSENGVDFECITRDGLGDNHNQGLRSFAVSDDEKNPWMCIGTANPFYGTQIWRLQNKDLVFSQMTDTKGELFSNEKNKEEELEIQDKNAQSEKQKEDQVGIKNDREKKVTENKQEQQVKKDKENPETADHSNIAGLGMLLLASGAVIASLRKRKY